MTESELTAAPPLPAKRRWLGVLLSLFVPGFGLVRAGLVWRGIAWFIAIEIASYLSLLLGIWRGLPLWPAAVVLLVNIALFLASLVDSFRPGKLKARAWAPLFVLILLPFHLLAPSAARFLARSFFIPTDGMAPTLMGRAPAVHDCILTDRLTYRISAPRRGDVMVFRTAGIAGIHQDDPDAVFVQRVVGLPGEKIELRDGHVFLNGRQLGQSDGIPEVAYLQGPAQEFMSGAGSYVVPPHAYFTLGDNSKNSFDGRYWGFVPKANVYGRAARIYYPFSRIRLLP